jgi:hypothetical protein
MKRHIAGLNLAVAVIAVSAIGSPGMAANEAATSFPDVAPPGRSVGYVLTSKIWSTFTGPQGTDANNKVDCPEGMNDGPREQFAIMYPGDPKNAKLMDTQFERIRAVWHPKTDRESFHFKEPVTKTIAGVNLDGKIDPDDFTAPDGETGIDNQMFRVLGCVANYRPGGTRYNQFNVWNERFDFNRVVIELTNVDSFVNDDEVDVAIYKGRDRMLVSGTGSGFIPGGSQRIDGRYGKYFERHMKGRIKDGILTTDAIDAKLPETSPQQDVTYYDIRDFRFRLKVTPETAEGVWGGYTMVDNFHYQAIKQWAISTQSLGQEAAQSVYRAMIRHADAYPDPKTGQNTAISSAMQVKFVQVFVQHPQGQQQPRRVASAKGD